MPLDVDLKQFLLQWGQEFFTPGMPYRVVLDPQEVNASMGPGVFYSWNPSQCNVPSPEVYWLQWGQEFFTPGMLWGLQEPQFLTKLQWGQEFFTPGI